MTSTSSFGDCTDTSSLDPTKHVNFVQGMVLGVDDFRQQFAWHAGRSEMIARDLVGFGTISGLRLVIEPSDAATADPMIAVDAGLAVTPCGQFVRIKRRQCANLGEWLRRSENQARLAQLEETPGSPPVRIARAYVRFRYRECLTDDVPIPGEPCRSEEEAMAASRIADSWRLHFSFDAPAQHEEDAVRELTHWLRRIPVVEHTAATPEEVVQALRISAAAALASTGVPPIDLELGDPPADLVIGRDHLCACLRAALLFWTTELRWRVQDPPATGESGCGCESANASPPASAGAEQDILLGELWIPLRDVGESGGVEFDSTQRVELHQERRPYVLHLRMVQELMTCASDDMAAPVATFATVLATADDALLLWIDHPIQLDLHPFGALAIAVNDTVVPDFTIAAVAGTLNVFEIIFDDDESEASVILQRGDRIALSFHLQAILEPDGRTLRQALDQTRSTWLDRTDDTIVVRTIVGLLSLDDLGDVDTGGAADADVLTFRDGRWQPESVKLALDDLTDVEAKLPVKDGAVLAFGTDAWRPKELKLDDLVDVAVSTAESEQFLKFDGANWMPATIPAVRPTPVHSGIVNFLKVAAGTSGWFGPFTHGFREKMVMIRLGFETPLDRPLETAEDTDSAFGATSPRIVVGYNGGSPEFLIFLADPRDPREEGLPPMHYRVRWFAIPVTEQFPTVDDAQRFTFPRVREPIPGRLVAPGIILAEVAAGNSRVASIAEHLNVTQRELQPVLEELKAKELILVKNGIITLIK